MHWPEKNGYDMVLAQPCPSPGDKQILEQSLLIFFTPHI